MAQPVEGHGGPRTAKTTPSPFEEEVDRLVGQLEGRQAEAARLDAAIVERLARLGYRVRQESTP